MPGDRTSPGVVVVTRFIDKSAAGNSRSKKLFAGYIDYIDRDPASRNENFSKYNLSTLYAAYNDYMANPEKTGGLFTADHDTLGTEHKKALKRAFKTAYDNDGILWQTVISFDNAYLAELGIFDPVSGTINESTLQDITRQMMRETLKREHISHSAVWSAAIHYNTDNIHIHIAYTEPFSTRQTKNIDGVEQPKGYFHRSTIRAMKSKVVGGLLRNDYALLDEFVRGKFLKDRKMLFAPEDMALRKLWIKLYEQLPADKRQWHYNMNGMDTLRPLVDKITRDYLLTCHSEDLMAFQKLLLQQQSVFEGAYGQNSQYKNYASNKLRDLYTRMGNVTLAEMREFSRFVNQNPDQKHIDWNSRLNAFHLHGSIGNLKGALNQAFQDYHQNERAYEKLQHKIKQVEYEP